MKLRKGRRNMHPALNLAMAITMYTAYSMFVRRARRRDVAQHRLGRGLPAYLSAVAQ